MKEAFEKIKERLKGLDKYHDRIINLGEALSIVSEVEAEYEQSDHTDYANIELYAFWKEHQWIPCSERLPGEPEENPMFEGKRLELYLVSVKHDKYPWRAFWNGKDFTDGWSIVQPEAWMPLPEAYKPEKGE